LFHKSYDFFKSQLISHKSLPVCLQGLISLESLPVCLQGLISPCCTAATRLRRGPVRRLEAPLQRTEAERTEAERTEAGREAAIGPRGRRRGGWTRNKVVESETTGFNQRTLTTLPAATHAEKRTWLTTYNKFGRY